MKHFTVSAGDGPGQLKGKGIRMNEGAASERGSVRSVCVGNQIRRSVNLIFSLFFFLIFLILQ